MGEMSLALPLITLAGTAAAVMVFFSRRDDESRYLAGRVCGTGFILALLVAFWVWPTEPRSAFHGFLLADGMGLVAAVVVLLAGYVTVLLSDAYLLKNGQDRPEYYILLLFCAAGMCVMVMTDHLVTIFVGLEIMSLSLYVLTGSLRGRAAGIEGAMKYFLAGAFASGILLFGITLTYGATGTFALSEIATRLTEGNAMAMAGLLMMLAGFGFKVAAVPFHQWAPDVYEGAPTPITGFMSTAVKMVGFVALTRLVLSLGAVSESLVTVLAWMAGLSMTVANVAALAQKSVKRMLAYSSISHAGYILLALTALAAGGLQRDAVLFYLVTYAVMNLGAFGVLTALETSEGQGLTFKDLGGLKERHPLLAGCMLVFMLSLAGIPPTGGFLAKLNLFTAVIDRLEHSAGSTFTCLMVLFILNSVIGLAYYLRVVIAMYMTPAPDPAPVFPRPAWDTRAGVAVCAVLVLWLGFGPALGAQTLLSWVQQATG